MIVCIRAALYIRESHIYMRLYFIRDLRITERLSFMIEPQQVSMSTVIQHYYDFIMV